MRGKGIGLLIALTVSRITPAYAGKSKYSCATVTDTRDHPRLCGEKSHFVKCSRSFTGSPPPMRGKEETLKGITGEHGITPAYAGKSLLLLSVTL